MTALIRRLTRRLRASYVPVEESDYARGYNAGIREALRIVNGLGVNPNPNPNRQPRN